MEAVLPLGARRRPHHEPIETESKGIGPSGTNNGTNDLSIYTYLVNVSYQIQAHFEWNPHRPDLAGDRNEHKHYFIAKRMLERGGRRDIFLGTRECQGYVEPCEFHEGPGAYDGTPAVPFGLMVHGITYADEDGSGRMSQRLWRPVMEDGGDPVHPAGGVPHHPAHPQAAVQILCAGPEHAGLRRAVSGGDPGWAGLTGAIRPTKRICPRWGKPSASLRFGWNAPMLLPVAHTTQKVNVEVSLSPSGTFLSARVLRSDEMTTVIPCTEASAARTSGPVPHPLADKLQYLAGGLRRLRRRQEAHVDGVPGQLRPGATPPSDGWDPGGPGLPEAGLPRPGPCVLSHSAR